MKYLFTVLALVLLLSANIFAQRVVPVPSLTQDALFNAISTAIAGDILELASGGTYPNVATLTTTVPITIRTAPGFTKKARVVYSANTTGGYAGNMFSVGANLTIQNVAFDLKQGTVSAWGGVFLSRISTGIPGGNFEFPTNPEAELAPILLDLGEPVIKPLLLSEYGDTQEAALALLATTLLRSRTHFVAAQTDPDFDCLRDDSRFAALVERARTHFAMGAAPEPRAEEIR